MTRSSDLAAVLALALLSAPALADPLVSDAFGLFDPATTRPERLDWAGWTSRAGLVPPQAPDSVIIFAGPKSLVAGKDHGHVVGIAIDRHGNLVADGSPARVTVAGKVTTTRTRGGIADLLVPPQTRADTLFVGVEVGQRQSPKAMLGITADIASLRPVLDGPLPPAGPDTELVLTSTPLADRFGNPAPDGTGLTAILTHADGSHSLAHGLVLQNRATARLITRDIPGRAMATLTLGQQHSAPLPLLVDQPRATARPKVDLTALPDIDAIRLRLGPFLTADGYALSDGAQVSVMADLRQGETYTETAWVIDGAVELLLPFGTATDVQRITVSSPLGPLDLTEDWRSAAAPGGGP